jgi:hypothetical protein
LGIDCEPVDVNNPHATNWLIALVSPDDGTRLNLLRAALGIAKQKPPEVLEGKACDLLADALASIPQGLVPCIFHSFTTHHFEDDEMTEFGAIQAEYGQRRELYSISFEWERQDGQIQMRKPVPLKLTTFGKGSPRERIFGLADNRGGCEAIEWLAPA